MRTMEQVKDEIQFRWREALNFLLFKGYSKEDIRVLSQQCLKIKPGLFIQENDEETFYGIIALGGFEELTKRFFRIKRTSRFHLLSQA